MAKRTVIVMLGMCLLAATSGGGQEEKATGGRAALATQKKGNVERIYEGESAGGTLQEALAGALQKLDKDLPEGGVADAMASWHLLGVSGTRGGFAAFRSVKVRIAATRTPPWTK
jgi:hypothetical protein